MVCVPKVGLMPSETPSRLLATAAQVPVVLYVFLFCAETSDGKDEAPAAKIRRKSKAQAGNPENSANVLDLNGGGVACEQLPLRQSCAPRGALRPDGSYHRAFTKERKEYTESRFGFDFHIHLLSR